MKVWTIAALAALTMAAPAMAQTWTSNRLGNTTFFNGTDAKGNTWTGTENRLGDTTFTNFTGPNGQTTTCTTNRLGSTVFTNCN